MTRAGGPGDRAVSDTLAYILTFSIIITSVGIVSVAGMNVLGDMRDDARTNTAEVSIEGVTTALDDLRSDGAPRRMVQLRLGGDALYLRESTISVNVSRDGSWTNRSADVRALSRQTDGDVELVYAAGGAYREQPGDTGIIVDPPFRCGEDTAHVSVVALRGDVSVASSSGVTIQMNRRASRTLYPDEATDYEPQADNVTVNVTGTQYRETWEQVFESELSNWASGGADGTYTCEDVNRVVVHETVVDLRVFA